ncbi:MAG TPA: hypothetical protein VJN93_09680 [Candidatus Acidoferrum sp.]|nr:hypothetical protein [Candidatus Acidoferrum sp.]
MAEKLSAVDSISPAFERTKRILFQPFRLGLWGRLAIVALVTGEIGGGGGGGSSLGNIHAPQTGDNHWRRAAQFVSGPGWDQVQPYLFWITLGGVCLLGLVVLWMYCDSVYRFILLDAVLTRECELKEGWRRWREAGRRYLLWVLAYGFGSLIVLGVAVGLPVLMAASAGWFDHPDDHLGGLIGGGILFFLAVLALLMLLAAIDLIARDFLVPVMALERVGAMEGWDRLKEILMPEKGAVGMYVLMKIVLSIGSAIIFTILNLLVILILIIPLGLVGVILYAAGAGAKIQWDPSAALLFVAFILLVIAGLLYVIAFVYAPGLVFFQSYAVEFFGSRYEPLRKKLMPEGSESPATPTPTSPPRRPLPPWPQMPPESAPG